MDKPKNPFPSNPITEGFSKNNRVSKIPIKSNFLPPPSNKERVVLPPSNKEKGVSHLPSRQGSVRQKPSMIKETYKNLPQSSKYSLIPRHISSSPPKKVASKTYRAGKKRSLKLEPSTNVSVTVNV